MKTVAVSLLFFGWILSAFGQGTFWFWNISARTRIGSVDGLLAGPNIFGQMLVGQTPDSLTPIGMPEAHNGNGLINGGTISVGGIGGGVTAYLQLVAWDGNRWGSSIESVPAGQFGMTDIVPHILSPPSQASFAPQFTQPAIVPIPEPSTISLAVLGGLSLLFFRRRRRSKRQA